MEHGHRLSSFSYSICMALVIPTATPPLLVVHRCITGSAQAWSTTAKINFAAFVFGLVLLYIATTKPMRTLVRAWAATLVLFPSLWACALTFMPYDSIVTVASRDGETKDVVRLANFMCGVAHAVIAASGHHPNLLNATMIFSLMVTVICDSAALCLRLEDPFLVRLPVTNVFVPWVLGCAFATAMHRDDQQKLQRVRRKLIEAETRADCLESARKASLLARAAAVAPSSQLCYDAEVRGGRGYRETSLLMKRAAPDRDPYGQTPLSPPPGPPSSSASVCSEQNARGLQNLTSACPTESDAQYTNGILFTASTGVNQYVSMTRTQADYVSDGARCSNSMRVRGLSILAEAANQRLPVPCGALMLTDEQRDCQLMPPPPPRATLGSTSKRPRLDIS